MKQKWTDEEVKKAAELKQLGHTYAQIGFEVGRTGKSVEVKLSKSTSFVTPNTDFRALADHWKRKAGELERTIIEAAQSKTAVEILCEQVHELAPKSYQPAPYAVKKGVKRGKPETPQSAVLLLSDQHIGAVVKSEQTLQLGEYNFEIFLRRLHRLEGAISSILKDHTNTEVSEIVIAMLGDALDGALTHSAECGQSNSMLAQFYSGGHATAQFLRNLSVLAPLRIHAVVGNHPRWQNQHKMGTKNRNSNFDMLFYLYVQALTTDIKTITWNLDWQPFASFEVQGFPFFGLHGDNLRGGDKILGLPAHAMGRMVSTTTQLFTRAGKDTPAYYCLGHLHRPISVPHAKGEIIVNGAFPGIDGYALTEFFNSSYPLQKFFLMHPKHGKTASYDIRLDWGDKVPHGYSLPDAFPCQ